MMHGSRLSIRRPQLLVGAFLCLIVGSILFGTWVNDAVACAQEKTRLLAQAFPQTQTQGDTTVLHCRRTQVVADKEAKKGQVTFSISVQKDKDTAASLPIEPSGSGAGRVYSVPKGAVVTVHWKPSDSLANVYTVKRSDTGVIYSSTEATNKDEQTDPNSITFTELDQSVTYTANIFEAGETKDPLDEIKIESDEGKFHVVFDAHGKYKDKDQVKDIDHNSVYRHNQADNITTFRIPDPSESLVISWRPVGLDRKPFAIVLDNADVTIGSSADEKPEHNLPDTYISALTSKPPINADTITYKAYIFDEQKKEVDKSKQLGQLDILLGAAKSEISVFTVNGVDANSAPIGQYSENMLLQWEMSEPTDASEFDLAITDDIGAATKAVLKATDISADDKTFSVITSFRDLVKNHLGVDGKPRKPLPGTYTFTLSTADGVSEKTVPNIVITPDAFSFRTQAVAVGWCTPQDDNGGWCPRKPGQSVGVPGASNIDWYIQDEGQGVVRFGHGMNGIRAELFDEEGSVCSTTTQPIAFQLSNLIARVYYPVGQDGYATFSNTDQNCLGKINPDDTYKIRFIFNGEQYRYFIYDEGGVPVNESNPNGIIGPNGAVNGVTVGPFSKLKDGDFESYELAKRPTILGKVTTVNEKRANPPFGLCLRYAEGRVFNGGDKCDFYRPMNANQSYRSYHFFLDAASVGVAQGNVRLTPGPGESRTFLPNPFYINITPEHPVRYIPLYIH